MNAIKAKSTGSCCSSTVMLLADGELEPSRLLEVESHLKACDGCRAELELVQAMRKSLRQSCARRASNDARARIELTIRGASSSKAAADLKAIEAPFLAAQRVAEARANQASNDVRGRRWAAASAVQAAASSVHRRGARHDPIDRAERAEGMPASSSFAVVPPIPTPVRQPRAAKASADWNFDSVVHQCPLHANPLPPEDATRAADAL